MIPWVGGVKRQPPQHKSMIKTLINKALISTNFISTRPLASQLQINDPIAIPIENSVKNKVTMYSWPCKIVLTKGGISLKKIAPTNQNQEIPTIAKNKRGNWRV